MVYSNDIRYNSPVVSNAQYVLGPPSVYVIKRRSVSQ